MVGTLKSVLVCSPRAAGWDQPDRAAHWQALGFRRPPDFAAAQSQHEALCAQLKSAEVQPFNLPPAPDLTLDGVYTHDASIVTDHGLIAMHPGKQNRLAEAAHHASFCRQLGIPTLAEIAAPAAIEAGDILWLDSNTLLIGRGFRTNSRGIGQMLDLLSPKGIEVFSAPLPYGNGPSECLHLMSLISLLDEQTALVDLSWLAVETVELLQMRGFKFIEIESSERDSLACNVLALGNNRLLAIEENRQTNARLHQAGFDVRTFPGSDLCINGGGGPTCLTRPLSRV